MNKAIYNVNSISLQCDCTQITKNQWDNLMNGSKRANKKLINGLVKKHLPELFNSLALQYPNPCNYYKTNTHFILIHSKIEYFIKVN